MDSHPLLSAIHRTHLRLSELERHTCEVPGGPSLPAGELHAILAVAAREGSNLTELAAAMGVSVPAMFKFTAKLLRKGYLSKEKLAHNGKEVVFRLTDLGKVAVGVHETRQKALFEPLQAIEAQLPASERQIIQSFMDKLKEALP